MSYELERRRTVLSAAVAAALMAPGAHAQKAIEEVVVTATKREASTQDIPVAVQALGDAALEQQNVQTFTDYVKFLPSVSRGGRGPGQNEIYIRGAAVDAINITVAESQGSAPNVALYLDEQPVTAGGRNLDVYVSDMQRIEVLPGPQGTLYGASSMAGTVRLITNKPKLDTFEASFNGSWSTTSDGDDSNSAELMLNIPLIDGKLAGRIAMYNDNQGGYIDNVEGTFTADPALNPTFPGDTVFYPEGTVFANGNVVGPGGVTVPVVKESASSSALVEDNLNDPSFSAEQLASLLFVSYATCLRKVKATAACVLALSTTSTTTGRRCCSTRASLCVPRACSTTTPTSATSTSRVSPKTRSRTSSARRRGRSMAVWARWTCSTPAPSSIERC